MSGKGSICIERRRYAFGGHKCLKDGSACGFFRAFFCGMREFLSAAWRRI